MRRRRRAESTCTFNLSLVRVQDGCSDVRGHIPRLDVGAEISGLLLQALRQLYSSTKLYVKCVFVVHTVISMIDFTV